MSDKWESHATHGTKSECAGYHDSVNHLSKVHPSTKAKPNPVGKTMEQNVRENSGSNDAYSTYNRNEGYEKYK